MLEWQVVSEEVLFEQFGSGQIGLRRALRKKAVDPSRHRELIAYAALVEGAYLDGRPQWHMEPERSRQSPVDLSYRHTAEHEIYDVNLEDYH
jgi:hypothetical protein